MGQTSIEWTEKTWNPVRGCSKVSQGCKNCYAMRQAHRFSGPGQPYEGLTQVVNGHPVWTGKIHLAEDKLEEPLHWKKPCRIFVNSMSDLFHEEVPLDFLQKIWRTMVRAHRERGHEFQVLTKRPQVMLERLTSLPPRGFGWYAKSGNVPCPESGIWLGVSCEDQATADERIPLLLETPAAVRWVSYEPALGPVSFDSPALQCRYGTRPFLNWVVVGGESGPGARPFNIQWARDVIAQCKAADVPCFVKQLGARPVFTHEQTWEQRPVINGIRSATWDAEAQAWDWPTRDRKGGDIEEFPVDLRVREYPHV